MAHFDKWLADVEPDEPTERVGKAAIRVRLKAVLHFLKAVGNGADREESIHQLRIWTRRAGAALRLFDPLVPKRAGRKMKRRLRKLRAAAGQERDCDVLLERLKSGAADPPKTVVKALKSQRREGRQELDALCKRKLRRRKFERQIDKLIGRLAWPKRHSSRDSPAFAAWCRSQLLPLGEQFFAQAEGKLTRNDELHKLRIAGKRLRYALELAPAAMPARLHHRLYAALTDLQERLGTVCDHLSAVARLEEWRADAKSRRDRQALQSQIRREQEELARQRKQFLRWWNTVRRGRWRADWDAALANQAG